MKYDKPLYISTVILVFINMAFCMSYTHLSSQTISDDKKWNFLADAYLMFPYMNGEVSLGESITYPVDATAGDIFNKLQMGAMLYFEAKTEKWAITSDMVYMNLTQDVSPTTLIPSGSVGAKQFIWEAAGMYRIFSYWEIGIGGRLNYLQTNIDAQRNVILPAGTEEVKDSYSKTWFDPVIITRFSTDIKDKWLFQFRGDVGGFGIGSDLTWQLQAYAGYRFTQVFQLSAGYRVLSTDFKSGDDQKEFRFNVKEFGPVLRLGFNF